MKPPHTFINLPRSEQLHPHGCDVIVPNALVTEALRRRLTGLNSQITVNIGSKTIWLQPRKTYQRILKSLKSFSLQGKQSAEHRLNTMAFYLWQIYLAVVNYVRISTLCCQTITCPKCA